MEWRTEVKIPRSKRYITHKDKFLLLGSCFADTIGERMTFAGFDCMCNPFGVLYNPASIAALLLRSISEKDYDEHSPELFRTGEPGCSEWHSWMHHSTFSAPTRKELITRINETMHSVAERIRQSTWIIITLGTSFVYRMKDSGMLVANCHKQPSNLFVRERLSTYDIVDQWRMLLQLIHSINPDARVLFTVSPIRHKGDGMHQNQLSKGGLLLAVDELVNECEWADYFPSYEIMMDELRDYRFYADDMIHPSNAAVNYIWECFYTHYFTTETQLLAFNVQDLNRALQHKPFNPESKQYKDFIAETKRRIASYKKTNPYICWPKDV